MSNTPQQPPAQDDLVIPARPQIAVTTNEQSEVVISTSFIADDFRNVEHGEVVIPAEDLHQVIEALQRIASRMRR